MSHAANNGIYECYHLFGPTLIPRLLHGYLSYFTEHLVNRFPGSHHILTADVDILKFINDSTLAPESKLSFLDGVGFCLAETDIYSQALQSVEDSLIRGLSTNAGIGRYYDLRNTHAGESLLASRKNLYYQLFHYYLKILAKVSPSRVYLSHHSYDVYYALFHASSFLDIPVTLVNGGHQSIYDITSFPPRGIGKDSVLREHIELQNHTAYTSHLSSYQPSSRTYCMPSGSLVEMIPLLRSCQGKTSDRVIILSLPVFSELNVEIFNENRLFIDRLSWLTNTLGVLSTISHEICLIIRLHPNAVSYGEDKWIKRHLARLLDDWQGSFYITDSNAKLAQIINENPVSLEDIDFLIYQGSLSIELPQHRIRPICGVSPLGTKQMTLSTQCFDEYTRILTFPHSFQRTVPNDVADSAKCAVTFDNLLARASEAEPHMQEFDQIYHFGKVTRPASDVPVLLTRFNNQVTWHAINAASFTSYMLRSH
jgi:hypothetical protein